MGLFAELTKGLGEYWATTSIALKRYPCHVNAHAAVKALSQLQAEHGFTGGDVEAITIAGTERMATLHNIPEPADLMMAQYSVPFCAALALYRDPRNPESFADGALDDPQIRALTRRVTMLAAPPASGHGASATEVTVDLKGGRRLTNSAEDGLLDAADLGDKFTRLTRAALGDRAGPLFERLHAPRARGQPRLARRRVRRLSRCSAPSAPPPWRSATRRPGRPKGRR